MPSDTPQTELRVQLRMKDMDRLGHLNHTCYHDFFLEARAGLMEPIRTDNERFVVARVEAEFLHEVRLADGYVDEQWAKEHHEIWYEEVKAGKRHERIVGSDR